MVRKAAAGVWDTREGAPRVAAETSVCPVVDPVPLKERPTRSHSHVYGHAVCAPSCSLALRLGGCFSSVGRDPSSCLEFDLPAEDVAEPNRLVGRIND